MKERLDRRARRHGRSTAEEVREILRNALREDLRPKEPLGSRLAGRFPGLGLDEDVSEVRSQPPRSAEFDL